MAICEPSRDKKRAISESFYKNRNICEQVQTNKKRKATKNDANTVHY